MIIDKGQSTLILDDSLYKLSKHQPLDSQFNNLSISSIIKRLELGLGASKLTT